MEIEKLQNLDTPPFSGECTFKVVNFWILKSLDLSPPPLLSLVMLNRDLSTKVGYFLKELERKEKKVLWYGGWVCGWLLNNGDG